MGDDIRPLERVYVTLGGRRWELVMTGKLTFPETRTLKRVSGGMSLTEVEEGINNVDPDAWFAWIYVSIQREQPSFTVAELEAAIGDTPVVAVIASVEKEGASEVAAPDPPASASESDATERHNGSDSGSKTPGRSTPATAGQRT
jgi:hypothetical protein